jgi:thymidine kinase
MERDLHKDYDVIGIDEAQFFEDVMLQDDLKHSFLDCCWM